MRKKASLFLNREPKQRKTIKNIRYEKKDFSISKQQPLTEKNNKLHKQLKKKDFSILNRESKQRKTINNIINWKKREKQ